MSCFHSANVGIAHAFAMAESILRNFHHRKIATSFDARMGVTECQLPDVYQKLILSVCHRQFRQTVKANQLIS